MKKAPNPIPWMLMTKEEVLNKFADRTTAYSDGEGDQRWVFLPGTRKDRVLLVAHADTIQQDRDISIGFSNDVIFSKNRTYSYGYKDEKMIRYATGGQGIQADDRAGCAICWELSRLGHSVLITSGEECGGLAAKWISKSNIWSDILNNEHNFAVQFDRHGSTDAVFYHVGSKAFSKYVEKSMSFVKTQGTYTDICELCTRICGVNLSVGYYFEHSQDEKLVFSQWLNTLKNAYNWLSQESLPKFLQSTTEDFLEVDDFQCCKCNLRFSWKQFYENNKQSCPSCKSPDVLSIGGYVDAWDYRNLS